MSTDLDFMGLRLQKISSRPPEPAGFDSEHVTGSDRCVAANPKRLKCHNDEAGYIGQRQHPFLEGRHVVLYNAHEQGMDPAGGRFAVVCEGHGSAIVNTTLRDVAYAALNDPTMFCDGCREGAR